MTKGIKLLKNAGLLGSCIVAWLAFFEVIGIKNLIFPFQPVGSIGSPIFRLLENTEYVTIALPVSLRNDGNASGCIVDLALKLKATRRKTEWTFFPAYILNQEIFIYTHNGQAELSIEGPFTKIKLEGKQSVFKPLFFLHRPAKGINRITTEDLSRDEPLKLELYALKGNSACRIPEDGNYRLLASEEVSFSSEALAVIRAGQYYQPLYFKLDTIRENFITRLP